MLRHIFLLLLSEICEVAALYKSSAVDQVSGVLTARVGENVSLKCSYQDDTVNYVFWYQQQLGGKPAIISRQMVLETQATISSAFRGRFEVEAKVKEGNNLLIIRNIQPSDSATYFCGILEYSAIEFGQGVFLHVTSSSSSTRAVVHQPRLEPLQQGDSVNLSCTVNAEACAGEQSFYWVRHGAAQPAVMFHRAGRCVQDSESLRRECTSNLALRAVSSSDAGTYYCALDSCGEIVFGNGTRVQIKGGSTSDTHLLVYGLSAALAASIILLLILAFFTYKVNEKSCSVCKGSVSHPAGPAASEGSSRDVNFLHYVPLSLKRSSDRHRQGQSVETDCVYSRVKSRKE
ncbi:signal-regulatory protein beta-2-like [Cheilinus undulatus]|uniref:signal-regulatory protein beta-2-like n=1 Tax=Cheilinus undulatus TaxID=241271 RepID=UPI001BD4EE81|nr:signal-regulatory protein beta-2-like [Cheilinus undulatus]